jgi:hypothetical protein
MPNYKKGEPANRSKNRKDVFTPGEIKESGSLGYMVASLMRALARSKDKKAISKLAKTPSGSSPKYPKSNVKVKKAAVKKTPQYRASQIAAKRTKAKPAPKTKVRPAPKKKAPAKQGGTGRDFERISEANRQARILRARERRARRDPRQEL